jgi:uncharacterized RDD family membrane protein YckC
VNEPLQPEAVLGLDNVALELPLAGAGSRVLAAALDYAIVSVLVVGWVVGAFVGGAALGLGFGWTLAAVLVGIFLLDYGYFATVEVLSTGRSAGKAALSLRVVARDGARAGVGALLLRNALRSVDLVVGVPMILLDPLGRRLGDRLAGTLVVHERPAEPEIVLARLPRGWSSAEAAIVESYLRRAGGLEPQRSQALGQKLILAMQRDDPEFLPWTDESLPALERVRRAVTAG